MPSDRPFTTGQAAEYCHVSQATIINWIKDRKLSGYTTPGGHYRIPRSDLVSFLKSHDMPVDTTLQPSAQARLLVLSSDSMIRDLARTVGKNNNFDVSLVTSDYATSAEAIRSKPDAVVIDADTSSDPVGLCQWLSETVEDTALLVVCGQDGVVEATARTVGADVYRLPPVRSSLEPDDGIKPVVGQKTSHDRHGRNGAALSDLEAKLEALVQ